MILEPEWLTQGEEGATEKTCIPDDPDYIPGTTLLTHLSKWKHVVQGAE